MRKAFYVSLVTITALASTFDLSGQTIRLDVERARVSVENRTSFYQDSTRANLKILLPDEDAELWFNGVFKTQFGSTRYFQTSPLPEGGLTYTIRARWSDGVQVQDQLRRIQVRPGQTVTVNFRIP